MSNPFAAAPRSIPVRIAAPPAAVEPGTAVIRLTGLPHHAHGVEPPCPACAAQLDLRARLFELLQELRGGLRPAFSEVLVLVSDGAAAQQARDVLTVGTWPARALRDHTVAKSFHLAPVLTA